MTNPNSMIEYKDITEKVTNTRVELMNEQFANNPEKKRPLVFRGYITEADRIKDTVKNNKYLYYLPDYEKIKQEKKKLKKSFSPYKTISKIVNLKSCSLNKNKINQRNKSININDFLSSPNRTISHKDTVTNKSANDIKNSLISQPTMRYKPRTDLERIYDVLNTYHCDENPKQIIEMQLKTIHLYDYKKPNNSLNDAEKEDNADTNLQTKRDIFNKNFLSKSIKKNKNQKKINLYKINRIYYNPKIFGYKPWQRREDLNEGAYALLNSYHYKTHFKAAEEIAESNYKYDKKNKNSVFLLPNLNPKKYEYKPHKTEDSEEKKSPFNFEEEEEENTSENYEDYEEFDKQFNPNMQKKKDVLDPEAMKILTKIAFKIKKPNHNLKSEEIEENEENQNLKKFIKNKGKRNFSENNNVIIKNKLYYKNTQFDKITNEVLEMCNVHSTKSKFNNTIHKAKGGKTMITQGMTVKDFEKKYRLQE